MSQVAGARQSRKLRWPADDAGPAEDDRGGQDEDDRSDAGERPEAAREGADVAAAEDMCSKRRAKGEGELERGHAEEQDRRQDGREAVGGHRPLPLAWRAYPMSWTRADSSGPFAHSREDSDRAKS